jgi:hypothetical protein
MLTLLFLLLFGSGDYVEIYTEPTCPPCRELKSDLRADPSILGDWERRDLRFRDGRSKGVRLVPTLIKYRDGKEVDRVIGYGGPDALRRWIAK